MWTTTHARWTKAMSMGQTKSQTFQIKDMSSGAVDEELSL